jgi:hypothetical protein
LSLKDLLHFFKTYLICEMLLAIYFIKEDEDLEFKCTHVSSTIFQKSYSSSQVWFSLKGEGGFSLLEANWKRIGRWSERPPWETHEFIRKFVFINYSDTRNRSNVLEIVASLTRNFFHVGTIFVGFTSTNLCFSKNDVKKPLWGSSITFTLHTSLEDNMRFKSPPMSMQEYSSALDAGRLSQKGTQSAYGPYMFNTINLKPKFFASN